MSGKVGLGKRLFQVADLNYFKSLCFKSLTYQLGIIPCAFNQENRNEGQEVCVQQMGSPPPLFCLTLIKRG